MSHQDEKSKVSNSNLEIKWQKKDDTVRVKPIGALQNRAANRSSPPVGPTRNRDRTAIPPTSIPPSTRGRPGENGTKVVFKAPQVIRNVIDLLTFTNECQRGAADKLWVAKFERDEPPEVRAPPSSPRHSTRFQLSSKRYPTLFDEMHAAALFRNMASNRRMIKETAAEDMEDIFSPNSAYSKKLNSKAKASGPITLQQEQKKFRAPTVAGQKMKPKF